MPSNRDSRNREETLRLVDTQGEKTSRAFSLLCQAWIQMGSEFAVGTTRVMADTLEDLSDLYCAPKGDVDSRKSPSQQRRSGSSE